MIVGILTGPGPDPLIALTTAAQLHPRLKLGTTMLLPGRIEVRLAKSLATLDVLSAAGCCSRSCPAWPAARNGTRSGSR